MGFEDKSINCSECGTTFTFSAGEQEFFAQKGFANEPRRCPSCRATRNSGRGSFSGGGASKRQMFPVICAQCGKETEVPFEPRGDRPVYCSTCYGNTRPGSGRF